VIEIFEGKKPQNYEEMGLTQNTEGDTQVLD